MIDWTPGSIAMQIGPISVFWYGICYAVALAAAYLLMTVEAKRRGEDLDLLPNGMIVVAVAALIGGRAYHVIDQWALYRDDLLKIVLPPYTGLGAYGGLFTGILALAAYAHYKRVSFWIWADIAAPAVFLVQGIARWGNFFNQELYGPPTNLPWGIAIQCSKRIAAYACPPGSDPNATLGQHFQPLFLYESLSGLIGCAVLLFLARRLGGRLRPGDLVAIFFIWYGLVRFSLETLRSDNWTFFGIPVAQIVSLAFVAAAIVILVYRHRGPRSEPPSGSPEQPPGRSDASASLAPSGEPTGAPVVEGAGPPAAQPN
ncbi:MAG TPA: prolipoprotein diacylglyceryl transferase [Candidatus Saccharimonadales bacterium]|nr:prolipoprotein diacylglyceryl transferase [Candidatus Saccharimonadales bacterium]